MPYKKGGGEYMNQMLGEIKLVPYDDVPEGWLRCKGQSLHISKYPKLYMLIGTKFGKKDEQNFNLPNLKKEAPEGLTYYIAVEGNIPEIQNER